jgi:hypothetical protein
MSDTPEEDDSEGEPFFRVLGVRCKAMSSDLVKMGWQLKAAQRVVVKLRVGEDRATAVRRHARFDDVRARIAAMDAEEHGAFIQAHTA